MIVSGCPAFAHGKPVRRIIAIASRNGFTPGCDCRNRTLKNILEFLTAASDEQVPEKVSGGLADSPLLQLGAIATTIHHARVDWILFRRFPSSRRLLPLTSLLHPGVASDGDCQPRPTFGLGRCG